MFEKLRLTHSILLVTVLRCAMHREASSVWPKVKPYTCISKTDKSKFEILLIRDKILVYIHVTNDALGYLQSAPNFINNS